MLITLVVNNTLEKFFKIFIAVFNQSVNMVIDFDIVHCVLSYRTKWWGTWLCSSRQVRTFVPRWACHKLLDSNTFHYFALEINICKS